MEEYYRWIFENSVPGLPETAANEGLSRWNTCGSTAPSRSNRKSITCRTFRSTPRNSSGRAGLLDRVVIDQNGKTEPVGVLVDGKAVVGFPRPRESWSSFPAL